MISSDTVTKRSRQASRLTPNRHSFFGFESGSMLSHNIATESPPTKCIVPDSQAFVGSNLTSTPTSKVLHPLIEDESPSSPYKVSRTLFNEISGEEPRLDPTENSTGLIVTDVVEIEEDKNSSNHRKNSLENAESVKESYEIREHSFPLKIGDTIKLGGGDSGRVRFIGKTEFADGIWAGLELTNPKGIMSIQYSNSYFPFMEAFFALERCNGRITTIML